MSLGKRPSQRRAPIMSNYDCLLFTEVGNQPHNILNQGFNAIVLNLVGLVAEVISAQVRSDRVILCSDDRELVPPGIPELRKAVQQDYELVSRATLRVMKTNAIELRVSETNGWINGWIHYASADAFILRARVRELPRTECLFACAARRTKRSSPARQSSKRVCHLHPDFRAEES